MSDLLSGQFRGAFSALLTPGGDLVAVQSRRTDSEIELPGGGVGAGESAQLAAGRETFEETGFETFNLEPSLIAILQSRLGEKARTALFVYSLTAQQTEDIDLDFSGDETNGLLLIPPRRLIALPTHEEHQDAPQKTFRAQRLFAAIALGLVSGKFQEGQVLSDSLNPPFMNAYLRGKLRRPPAFAA
jgi:8-oxo-dGTP pyrophosphatase MutT (NUDIX family)